MESEAPATAAGCYMAPRAGFHFAASLAAARRQVFVSPTRLPSAHITAYGHRTAVTKIPAQGNRQGYINNGYRRCP